MKISLVADIEWMKNEHGGRRELPINGQRATIRWQRYIQDWLSTAWDVEILELDIEANTRCGTARLKFSEDASPDSKYLKQGELIELLDAYRVIGVGKIISIATD